MSTLLKRALDDLIETMSKKDPVKKPHPDQADIPEDVGHMDAASDDDKLKKAHSKPTMKIEIEVGTSKPKIPKQSTNKKKKPELDADEPQNIAGSY